MPSHKQHCTWCGTDTYCHNDEHALGCGGGDGRGGCDNPPFIEFCSLECLIKLREALFKAEEKYKRMKLE